MYNKTVEYYREHGSITAPKEYASWLTELPAELPQLAKLVQDNMLHLHWTERYGVAQAKEHWNSANARFFTEMIAVLHEDGWLNLYEPKPFNKRLVATCRSYSVFMTTLCRAAGIPARSRCGFATYFGLEDVPFVDHWVCEYWNKHQKRWVRYDAQLDEFQQNELHIDFSVQDLPKGRFWDGAESWQLIRKDGTDPNLFGIFDYRGIWFAACNLIRDLAALNKMPLLPWDMWAMMIEGEAKGEESFRFLDEVAEAICTQDYGKIAALYCDMRLKPTRKIASYVDSERVEVELT